MLLRSFLFLNLSCLCMKIINSAVVVGLYYGFLTTFSIGPSYLFLLRARVMEEGIKKGVSATTGFITGQLIMFISIYYAPLHLALGRPHTITFLVLPYLLFHFFWNNNQDFFDYGSNTRNSMRNLSIQCVFLNNLIFQLVNPFFLPSSTLVRLVNIYMFRCNNQMLFVTSSFVGWLIGHILFMKLVGLVLFWIRQKNSIRSNKYLALELTDSMTRTLTILLFITCLYYLGRIPSPTLTEKLKQTSEMKEMEQMEEIEDPKKRHGKERLCFEKPLVNLIFDYKRWRRPLRYINKNGFENAVRNEMSQYFFHTCTVDGKQVISFTYPPSLSIFLEMMQTKMSLCTTEKLFPEDLYNSWVYTNEQKKCSLSNEVINRIEVLNNGSLTIDALEKRTRLYNDKKKKECFPRMYDPFLNGPYRGTLKKAYSHLTMDNSITSTEDSIGMVWIKKIRDILLTHHYQKLLPKLDPFNRELLLADTENFLTSNSELARKPGNDFSMNLDLKGLTLIPEQRTFDSENQTKYLKFLFDAITTDPNDQTTDPNDQTTDPNDQTTGIEEISKTIPRWSYNLNDSLQEGQEQNEEESAEDDDGIRSRKFKRVVIYTEKDLNTYDSTNSDQPEEVALIRYTQQPDFCRDIINGSIRAQRRKIVTLEMFQANVHSPLFLDRKGKTFLFSFDISGIMNPTFRNWMDTETKFKTSDSEAKESKEKEKKRENENGENERIAIAETWDSIGNAQMLRGIVLVTQSFLRKYIILPSLIIVKNLGRMLLFQIPEWDKDFKEWNREMHVKCTYNGVPLSETEFPKDWLTDGIQIKILFPFCLKPWHRSKLRSDHRDQIKKKGKRQNFCFLTVWGTEAELPFGSARKLPSFFGPIYKELEKKMRKENKKGFQILRVLEEKTKQFIKVSKGKTKWIIKIILFLKRMIKEFLKGNPISLFGLNKVYEPSENGKDSITNNKIVHKSTIQKRSIDLTNYSLTEKKMKDLFDRTTLIRNKIEKVAKDKRTIFITPDRNIFPNDRSCVDKRSESQKHILKISKKRSDKFIFIRKWNSFLKLLSERIYIDIFLWAINIPRINAQLLLELTKKILDKYIYNDEKNKKGFDETNAKKMHFISTIKKCISNKNSRKSKISCDLYSLSQASVFYKLSQIQVSNKYRLRSLLQYRETYLIPKNRIRCYFGTRKILDSHKKPSNYGMNEWKNWLRGHYSYNLSQTQWSRLVPQKWRNRVNQRRTIRHKDSKKNSYEKNQLIYYEKKNDYVVNSLPSQKEKTKKQDRYDLFSYKYINYWNRKDSYIYRSPLKVNEKREITYNYNTLKTELFDVLGDIDISDYLEIDTKKKMDRKYFEWKNFHFFPRKNMDTGTNINKKFLDWMGMNEEMLYRPISNLESWFFSEFVPLYDAYKTKPWIIPIRLLILNKLLISILNTNEKISQNKNIKGNHGYLELENRNQEEKERLVREIFSSDTQKQQKDVKKDYAESNIPKLENKRQFKSYNEAELEFFLKRYLLFQLRWDELLNQKMSNNIKIYCFLLRLINPKEITISSIQRGELCLDVMLIQKDKDLTVTKLIKSGILIIEPMRLSTKWDGQFLLYQTIAVSLVHNKYQINERYREKRYVNENYFNGSIHQHRKMIVNGDENHYDLLVPENTLSTRRCRELRILICFNSGNGMNRNPVFFKDNNVKNCGQFLDEDRHIDTDINKFIQFKLFLWPNYRLEDLACINRYWFDTNNGSCFSMSRIRMYPRYRIS
uniref:Translocon at the inner envelope membrane of chloroplasts 214 n=1 Tax=Cassytha capillaris TaxID=1225354 RepID=A0A8F0I8E6_9MAGN|nr:hypothetical protein RF1 [Cassytha capillaris]